MMRMLCTRASAPLAAAAAGFVATVAMASPAAAATCDTLPNPVYITGSSAVGNFLQGIGEALAGTTTIVYASPGSCQGIDAVFNGTKMGTGTATYWDNTGTAQNCTLTNPTADIGVSDVYYTSCTAPYIFTALPSGVNETLGPHQVMSFVVPASSNQSVISAQAAYLIYGFGAAKNVVMPWNDPTVIFQRGAASGTQAMLAKAIGVQADKWLPDPAGGGLPNVVAGGSTGMFNAIVNAGKTGPNTTIGILASDVTDKSTTTAGADGGTTTVSNRSQVKILAYQHYGQDCAWLPDSSSTTFDKRNVREGHYALWGPIHFFTNGTKQAATDLVGYFGGTVTPPAGVKLLDLEIKGHTVPACAMKAQRTSEIGPITPYQPTAACGCYMEELLAPGTSGCTACTDSTGCTSTQTCSNGFCEAN